MTKEADVDYPINDLVKQRWSPRSFADKPVSRETLGSLFEAARWAPSCYNDQPWFFIVGSKDDESDTYDKLFDCLVEGNQAWAKQAPVLGMSVARKRFNHNDEENRHALHDVGLAMENLVLEGMHRDIYVHQMAGYSEETVHDHFDLPEDHEPVAAFALGYKGEPSSLPEDYREQEEATRGREPLSDFVFTENWGNPLIEDDS